jgi:hypothetical protein
MDDGATIDDSATLTERIIDRFGGIRPMAAKIDTPVTTVQGWKKRGIIPQSRHIDIAAAAARENIAVDAAELAGADPGVPNRQDRIQNIERLPADAAIEAPVARPATPAQPRMRGRAGGLAIALSVLSILALAGGSYAAWLLYLRPLEARVAALESRAAAPGVQNTGALNALASRVTRLEADMAHAPAPPGTLQPGPVQPGGTPDGRLAAIEQQLAELKSGAATTEQLSKRLSDLQIAAGGRELLAQSIRDIQSGAAATQGEVDRLRKQVEALGPRLGQIDAALADRRQQALRGEAVVLAVGQLRQALSGSTPFAKQLAAVRALVGGDAEMVALLDQIQPYADDGVPTFDDLDKELAGLAPEIVRSAAVGDGSGWWRQALYHISSVISIRRVGGSVPGDQADAIVARAQGRLEEDDLRGAVGALQTLSGAPAETAAPWIHDAGERLAVDSAEADMTRLAIQRIAAPVGSAPVSTAPVAQPAPAASQ